MTEDTNQEPSADESGPLTESAAADLLQEWRDDEEQKGPPVDSARAKANAAQEAKEAAEADSTPEAEPDTDAETSVEGDTDAEESDDNYVHGNAKTRLRDGSEVTVGELKKAFDEAQDFRRREAEFTAQRQEFETTKAQIAQQEQAFASTIEQAIAALQHTLPAEPDISLRESDPIAYAQQKWARDDRLQEIGRLQQAQQVQTEKAQAEQAENFKQFIAGEQTKLYDRIPELKDEGKRREFYSDLLAHGRGYGFSEEEINSIHDHRTMMMVRDAISWRKLKADRPKAVEKGKTARPVARPGERTAPAGNIAAKHKTLFERARKSKSIEDVGALLAELE